MEIHEQQSVLDVTVYVTSEIRHSSYIYIGLKVLLKEKYLNTLRFIPERYYHKDRVVINIEEVKRINRPYPYSIKVLLVNNITKKQVMLGFDLQDWDFMFSHHCLKECQIIYKRAFNSKMIEVIKSKYNNIKIKPFGFTHNIDLSDEKILFIHRISKIINKISYALCDPKGVTQYLVSKFNWNNQIPDDSRNIINNNQLTIPPNYPFIFYQVEYHHWPGSKEAESLNMRRADLIRLLKNKFGETFIGGMFFRTALNNKFIDCKTNVPYDHEIYLSFIKKASLVISTNGFGNSLPWKLAEYMQYGCCTLTESLKHKITSPIRKGIDAEIFNSDQECIELCQSLLNNNEKIELIKNNAAHYYNVNIKPDQALKKHLCTIKANNY